MVENEQKSMNITQILNDKIYKVGMAIANYCIDLRVDVKMDEGGTHDFRNETREFIANAITELQRLDDIIVTYGSLKAKIGEL